MENAGLENPVSVIVLVCVSLTALLLCASCGKRRDRTENKKGADIELHEMELQGSSGCDMDLIKAVQLGEYRRIEELLKLDQTRRKLNPIFVHPKTKKHALHYAASSEFCKTRKQITSLLLAHFKDKEKALLEIQDDNRNTPLHLAVKFKHKALVEFLVIERRADVLKQNTDGWFPIHFGVDCAQGHQTELLQCLVDKHGKILGMYELPRNLNVYTPEQIAAIRCNLDGMKWLHANGFRFAVHRGASLFHLLSNCPPEDEQKCDRAIKCMQWLECKGIQDIDSDAVERITDVEVDIESDDNCLHIAARTGNPTMLKFLSNECCTSILHNENQFIMTPLETAVDYLSDDNPKALECMKVLIEATKVVNGSVRKRILKQCIERKKPRMMRTFLLHRIMTESTDNEWNRISRTVYVLATLKLAILLNYVGFLTLQSGRTRPLSNSESKHDFENAEVGPNEESANVSHQTIIHGGITLATLIYLLGKELAQLFWSKEKCRYIKCGYNILEMAFALLGIVTVPFHFSVNQRNPILPSLTFITILGAYCVAICQLRVFPRIGVYISLLLQILSETLFIFVIYCTITITAFTALFWILLPNQAYQFPILPFKLFSILAGEQTFDETFNELRAVELWTFIPVLLLFSTFIFIGPIVTMNLMIGIAVNTTDEQMRNAEAVIMIAKWEKIDEYNKFAKDYPSLLRCPAKAPSYSPVNTNDPKPVAQDVEP